MAREFKETAHLNTNLNAYSEGWERIFAKKEEPKERSYNCMGCLDKGYYELVFNPVAGSQRFKKCHCMDTRHEPEERKL